MTTKHTPGPLKVTGPFKFGDTESTYYVETGDGVLVAMHMFIRGDEKERVAALAEATLHVAGRDMLKALEAVAASADAPMASGKRDGFTRPTEMEWRAIVSAARSAIAKARAES